MFPRLRLIPLVIALASIAGLAADFSRPVWAAPVERKTLVLQGLTVDQQGFPVGQARIVASGRRTATTTSNRAGEYRISVPLGTLAELSQTPLRIEVTAERKGWSAVLPDSSRWLAIELSIVTGPDGVSRCLARSNDPRIAAVAVNVMATEGSASAYAVLDFTGTREFVALSATGPELSHVAQAALAAHLEPATPGESIASEPRSKSKRAAKARPASKPPPAQPQAKAAERQPQRSSPIITPRPESEGRARSAPTVIRTGSRKPTVDSVSCACRVEGTVEVRFADRPLPAPLKVVVSLTRGAGVDTVELFMGSPRAFSIRNVTCGRSYQLRVQARARELYEVDSRDELREFQCEAGQRTQRRIVLGRRRWYH